MSSDVDISLTVNGERVARRVEARRHLIDFLRLDLGLMGSHTGCEHGVCGACTVRVDGRIVRGCLVLAASLDGAQRRDHRGRLRLRRDPRPAGGLRRPQRLPVRLLHAGHAAHRRRSAQHQPAADARRDPRAPLRQLLPLHRLSRHRRCGRDGGEAAQRKGRLMNEIIDPRSVDRPNSYIGKSVPRPNAEKLVEGRGQYVDDMVLPRMVHVAFVRSPHAHAKILRIDGAEALEVPGVLRVFTGADLAPHCEPWVATLGAPQRHEIGAAAAPAARARDLGRRGGRRGGGREPRRSPRMPSPRSRSTTSRCRPRSTWRRRWTPAHAGDPPRARRQPVLPARQRERQGRRGVRRRAQGRGGHLPHRPPHGRDAGAALDPGRLQPRRGQAHRLSRHPGAAHDAGRVRQAPAAARGRRARDLHRRRRQLRHQGARLPRRDRRRRHRQDHGAVRSSSSPTGWRASPATSTPATTASRGAWPSTPRAASPPSTSTT